VVHSESRADIYHSLGKQQSSRQHRIAGLAAEGRKEQECRADGWARQTAASAGFDPPPKRPFRLISVAPEITSPVPRSGATFFNVMSSIPSLERCRRRIRPDSSGDTDNPKELPIIALREMNLKVSRHRASGRVAIHDDLIGKRAHANLFGRVALYSEPYLELVVPLTRAF
jgi:hypothetical protein